MTESAPSYTVTWQQEIQAQEIVILKGIDPVKVDNLRRAAIALVRACDDLKYGDPNKTIPERRR